MMRCKKCGELDSSNTAYCVKCGRSPHELVKDYSGKGDWLNNKEVNELKKEADKFIKACNKKRKIKTSSQTNSKVKEK